MTEIVAAHLERVASDLAPKFHEAYERLAPQFGYETRKDSAVPWEQVPEPNRKLMEAVCKEVVAAALAACAREEAEWWSDGSHGGDMAKRWPGCKKCERIDGHRARALERAAGEKA